jgi:hypothetical protein
MTMTPEDIAAFLEVSFPLLAGTGYKITSPADHGYNCIAWAAGRTDRFWWPVSPVFGSAYYWPEDVPREESIDAFKEAYAKLGYKECRDGTLEPGFEKIALYAVGERPKHAARQLADGSWTSKLGKFVDIEHRLDALFGSNYGSVVAYLRRPATTPEKHTGARVAQRSPQKPSRRRKGRP